MSASELIMNAFTSSREIVQQLQDFEEDAYGGDVRAGAGSLHDERRARVAFLREGDQKQSLPNDDRALFWRRCEIIRRWRRKRGRRRRNDIGCACWAPRMKRRRG